MVYGRVGGEGQSARCLHGGGAMVWPIVQGYAYLDLTPIPIEIKLQGALSQQNIRVNTPATFTVGISTEPGVMQNAAERLRQIAEQLRERTADAHVSEADAAGAGLPRGAGLRLGGRTMSSMPKAAAVSSTQANPPHPDLSARLLSYCLRRRARRFRAGRRRRRRSRRRGV